MLGRCSPSADGGTEGGGPAHTHLPIKQLDLSSLHQDGDALPALQGGTLHPSFPTPGPEGPRVTTAVVLGKRVGVRRKLTILPPLPRPADQSGVAPRPLKGVLQEAAMTMHVCAWRVHEPDDTHMCAILSHYPRASAYSQAGRRAEGQEEEEEGDSGSVDTSAC